MDLNNRSKNTVEDDLLEESDFSSFSSATEMDKKDEEIQKLKVELQQFKEEANSNQFVGHSMMQTMDEKFGELKKEMDELKSAKDEEKSAFEGLKEELEKIAGENAGLNEKMAKMKEKFGGKNAKMGKLIEKLTEKIVDLEEKVGKLAKENGEMKAEFSIKNHKLGGKMRQLQEKKADKEMVGNLTGRIEGMEFVQLKNNKWNAADCGPELDISEGGLVVTNSGSAAGVNCIRAILPIPSFNLNSKKPSIAGYYEVKIIRKEWIGIRIGFCTQQFQLEGKWLENEENSIGIHSKSGMYIDGQFKKFGKNADKYFTVGDVVGLGIIHFPGNFPMKCFATLNGRLLGTVELPDHFSSLQVFPAATLFYAGDSIRANFGQETFRFDASQLLK